MIFYYLLVAIIVYYFWKRPTRKFKLPKNCDHKAYAIVTGASEGIGKQFAIQLAKRGYGLILLSRNKAKLDAVAAEISTETHVLSIDFSDPKVFEPTNPTFQQLETLLKDKEISILVNNVAVSHDLPTPFVEESSALIQTIVQVNITSVMLLTKLVLPMMKSAKNGLVLNMGSFSGMAPAPLLSVYGASKAFLKSWSIALAAEVETSGIHVEHLNTYFVATGKSILFP